MTTLSKLPDGSYQLKTLGHEVCILFTVLQSALDHWEAMHPGEPLHIHVANMKKLWRVRVYSLGGLIGIRWEKSWSRPHGVEGCIRVWVNIIPWLPLCFYQIYDDPEIAKLNDWSDSDCR